MTANGYSVAALAYLGDCVLELTTRAYLVKQGISDAGSLNAKALSFVKAGAQSAAMDRLEEILTEEEAAWFRRGRNYSNSSVPKNASPRDYRRATGMEVLFASLYVEGRNDRINELFEIAYQTNIKTEDLQ